MGSLPKYIVWSVIVVILAGLLGWYLVLRTSNENISNADAGRGSLTSTFGSTLGSTYTNIVNSLAGGAAGGGVTPRLWKVSATPVAGMDFATSSSRLRFVERATGYVLSADPSTGSVERTTNTLLPKVYEALLSGDALIARTLNDAGEVRTFAGILTSQSATSSGSVQVASTTNYTLKGAYIDETILALAVHPTTRQLFSLVLDQNGMATGVRSEWDGSKAKKMLSSAIRGWSLSWLADGRVVMAQKPADGIGGFAYDVESDGSLTPLVDDVPGLTVLPKASSPALLFGQSGPDVALFARANDSANAVRLPIRTSADKCVWSPGKQLIAFCAVPAALPPAGFLDNRFRGTSHTSDAWWRVDVSAGTAEILFSPETAGTNLDVVNPVIDTAGKYIAFLNARDQSLWMLRIAAQ